MKFARKPLILLGVVALGVIGFLVYQSSRKPGEIPELQIPDVSNNDMAGRIERTVGQPQMGDATSRNLAAIPGSGAQFRLNTAFVLPPQSQVQIHTEGNWIIALDGEGEFTIEDAKTNEQRTSHTLFWNVKKGTFRAKPYEYDVGSHTLEIKTAIARVVMTKAEVGIRVSEGGGGQIWVISGGAKIYWNDGRFKELTQKGMDYL